MGIFMYNYIIVGVFYVFDAQLYMTLLVWVTLHPIIYKDCF